MAGSVQKAHDTARLALVVGALGVVFGDIGTSPIYTLQTVFAPSDPHPVPVSAENVYGVVSLVFWSVMTIVTVTYVLLAMRADNDGEGGIMALITLLRRWGGQRGRRTAAVLAALGIFGAALFLGDSMITPAISVLSAVEGIKTVEPSLAEAVGELRPEIQSCLWDEPVSCTQYENHAESVAQTHASWLINHAAFTGTGFTGDRYQRAVTAAKSLGYELTVTEAALARDRVTVRVANRGVAPFYAGWRPELAAVDSHGRIVRRWHTNWNLTGIQPGQDPATLSARVDTRGLRPGRYSIVMRVDNPLRGGIPLRFANTAQNTSTGWLTLGTV